MPPARPRRERDFEVKRRKGRRERTLTVRRQAPDGAGPGVEGSQPIAPPQIRNIPRRFWAEVIMGATTGALYVVTPFRPDWMEAICGFDPDQHGGAIEWMIVMALLVVTLAMLGAFPWIEDGAS